MFTVDRTKFTVIIGSDNMTDTFKHSLVHDICSLAGGCTVQQGTGYWTEDATDTQDQYTGNLVEDEAFIIHVSTDTDPNRFYGTLQRLIARNVIEFGVKAEWIHVEAEQTTALHFAVSQQQFATV